MCGTGRADPAVRRPSDFIAQPHYPLATTTARSTALTFLDQCTPHLRSCLCIYTRHISVTLSRTIIKMYDRVLSDIQRFIRVARAKRLSLWPTWIEGSTNCRGIARRFFAARRPHLPPSCFLLHIVRFVVLIRRHGSRRHVSDQSRIRGRGHCRQVSGDLRVDKTRRAHHTGSSLPLVFGHSMSDRTRTAAA
jgi:hypothetical protein